LKTKVDTPGRRKVFCRDHFRCNIEDCPAFRARDYRCWLVSGTRCHDKIQGAWLEKMEACLACEVFAENITEADWRETLALVARQFNDYHTRIKDKQQALDETNRKLEEFKKTSIYLLKELDQQSGALEEERNSLKRRIREKADELNRIHANLVQSTKLAALGRFSAGIAHEINNPLGAIVNYTRTLLANPVIGEANRGYLELILKGLFRIEYIVRQVLSYSGGQKSDPRPTDVNRLIRDSVESIQHKLAGQGIRFQCSLLDGLPDVRIDPIQLQQVLINVLNNAIDAVEKDGRIEVRSSLRSDKVVVEVSDNGKGMGREELEHAFDPFYTTKEVGQGTGLGLFLSYNLLQIYRGRIELSSRKGKGTRATIELPVNAES